jgi:uncharacterized protein (DUF2141 family)
MSFVQRRRFLWILFLAGLALLAVAANATTLSRLRFEELANKATEICTRESRECQGFVPARKLTFFSGGAKANRFACWVGRKGRFESIATLERVWNT